MKKIISMLVIGMILMSSIVFAECNPTVGSITYEPLIDAPAIINYQTGEGYCSPSENVGGVILNLSACNDLIISEEYILLISIDTIGFSYVELANDATNISIAIKAYSTMDSLCNDIDGIDIETYGNFTGGYDNISAKSSDFIVDLHPYLLISIPSITYDKELVDGTPLIVSVSVVDTNAVCITCDSFTLYSDTFIIGTMSCFDSYVLTFPYSIYNSDDWWGGIVITNLISNINTISITLYTENDVFSFIKYIDSNKSLVFTIDSLLENENITGTICYMTVVSNSDIDGIAIFGNSNGYCAYTARK